MRERLSMARFGERDLDVALRFMRENNCSWDEAMRYAAGGPFSGGLPDPRSVPFPRPGDRGRSVEDDDEDDRDGPTRPPRASVDPDDEDDVDDDRGGDDEDEGRSGRSAPVFGGDRGGEDFGDEDDDDEPGPKGVHPDVWKDFKKCMAHHGRSRRYGGSDASTGPGPDRPVGSPPRPRPDRGDDDFEDEDQDQGRRPYRRGGTCCVGGPCTGWSLGEAELDRLGVTHHDRRGSTITLPADSDQAMQVLTGQRHLREVEGGWATYKYARISGQRCLQFVEVNPTPPSEPLTRRQGDRAIRHMQKNGLHGWRGWQLAERYARSR
jgi:hypothetical protein